MLAGNFQELACHRYYQFVPTRDTEIAGVIKDCGLRSNRNEEQEADLAEEEDLNGIDRENRNMMQNRRRFSYWYILLKHLIQIISEELNIANQYDNNVGDKDGS